MRANDKLRSDAARFEGRSVDDPGALASLRSIFFDFLRGMPDALVADCFTAFLARAGRERGVFSPRDMDRLSGIASAIAGEFDGAELETDDWTDIRDAANASGDEIPIETLMAIMSLVTERGAIH